MVLGWIWLFFSGFGVMWLFLLWVLLIVTGAQAQDVACQGCVSGPPSPLKEGINCCCQSCAAGAAHTSHASCYRCPRSPSSCSYCYYPCGYCYGPCYYYCHSFSPHSILSLTWEVHDASAAACVTPLCSGFVYSSPRYELAQFLVAHRPDGWEGVKAQPMCCFSFISVLSGWIMTLSHAF
jgi:hypothetical protein